MSVPTTQSVAFDFKVSCRWCKYLSFLLLQSRLNLLKATIRSPISPLRILRCWRSQSIKYWFHWCRGRDSNPHGITPNGF